MQRQTVPIVAFLALATCISADALASQTLIGDESACKNCVLDWTPEFNIGSFIGPGQVISRPRSVTLDGLGRFWILYTDAAPPAVFSPTGHFISDVGRLGAGPGEFRSPSYVLPVPGDSTVVFDSQLERATVFDQDLNAKRTIDLAVTSIRHAVVDRWPVIVANGPIRTSDGFGHLFHRIDLSGHSGRAVQSYGGDDNATPPRMEFGMARPFDQAGDGFWVAAADEYRLTKYDNDFRKRTDLLRRPDWFPGKVLNRGGPLAEPPKPGLAAVRVDNTARVWVFGLAPRPDFADAYANVPKGARTVAARDVDFGKLWDSVVEVIDVSSGQVIAKRRLGYLIVSVLDDGRLVVYQETRAGVPYLTVLAKNHQFDEVQSPSQGGTSD